MAAGAAGPPGDLVPEVKGQGLAAATIPLLAEVATTALDCMWSGSLVRTQRSSIYSKDTNTRSKLICHVVVGQPLYLTLSLSQSYNPEI